MGLVILCVRTTGLVRMISCFQRRRIVVDLWKEKLFRVTVAEQKWFWGTLRTH